MGDHSMDQVKMLFFGLHQLRATDSLPPPFSCYRASFLKELKELAVKRRQIVSSKSLCEDEKNTRLQELMLRNPLGSGPPLSIEDLG